MIFIEILNLAFWLYILKKDLTINYEKEKHLEVYEAHMSMYKKVMILKFENAILFSTLVLITIIKFFN